MLGYNKDNDHCLIFYCLLSYKEIEARILNGEHPEDKDFTLSVVKHPHWWGSLASILKKYEFTLTGNSVPIEPPLYYLSRKINKLLEIEEK